MGPTLRRETRLEIVSDPFNAVKDKIRAVWKVCVSLSPFSLSLPLSLFSSFLPASHLSSLESRTSNASLTVLFCFPSPLFFRRLHHNDKRNSLGPDEEMEEEGEGERPRKFARVEEGGGGEMEE